MRILHLATIQKLRADFQRHRCCPQGGWSWGQGLESKVGGRHWFMSRWSKQEGTAILAVCEES